MNSLARRRCPIDLADVGGSAVKLDLVGLGVVSASLPDGLKLNDSNTAGLEVRRDLFSAISSKIG